MNIQIERSLVEYLVGYLKSKELSPGTDIYRAIQGLEWTLANQSTNNMSNPTGEVGQKQLPSDPRRTDVGMGAMLNTNSDFL